MSWKLKTLLAFLGVAPLILGGVLYSIVTAPVKPYGGFGIAQPYTVVSLGNGQAATTTRFIGGIQPKENNIFDVGSASLAWRSGYFSSVCISGDCRASWASGGAGVGWTDNGAFLYNTTATRPVVVYSSLTSPLFMATSSGIGFSASGTIMASNALFSLSATTSDMTVTSSLIFAGRATEPPFPSAGNVLIHGQTFHGFTRLMQMDEGGDSSVVDRDNIFIAKNTSGATITKGQAVYVSGSTGNVPNIGLASATTTSRLVSVGMAFTDITNGNFGEVMHTGIIENINTSAFATGDSLWVSTTTAGGLTNSRPIYPNYVQRMGTVLVSGAGNGSIQVVTAPFLGGMETGTAYTGMFSFGGSVSSSQPFYGSDFIVGGNSVCLKNGVNCPFASTVETEGATSTASAITPVGLAGSNFGERVVELYLTTSSNALLAVNDSSNTSTCFVIPSSMNGMKLVEVHMQHGQAGSGNYAQAQIRNQTSGTTMLSTEVSIDGGELGSNTAVTTTAINAATSVVSTFNRICVDVDHVESTPGKETIISLIFRLL